MSVATTARPRRESLLTPAFRLILAITFLAFGMEGMIRAIVPLVVLDRGGDAVMVGLVTTVYSLPALFFRPLVGTLVDSWQHGLLYRAGILVASVTPALLFLPGIVTLMAVRFLNGTAWAFFSVSNHSLLAKLAPPGRRAEASGVFMSMPAFGQVVLPGLAVALYTASGHEIPPILLAMGMGLGAFAVTMRIRVPAPAVPVGPPDGPVSLARRFIEPSALPATAMLVTSYSAYSIFAFFAPVYVRSLGIPVDVLVLYFPAFGLAQALSQPILGRVGDVLGRGSSITLGALTAAAGLLIAIIPGPPAMVTFTVAALLFAVSQSLVNPTISALVMERAPRHRLGSAMATWSIGFQFATGTSSILWGAIISSLGFTYLFGAAAVLQVVTIGLSRALLAGGRANRAG